MAVLGGAATTPNELQLGAAASSSAVPAHWSGVPVPRNSGSASTFTGAWMSDKVYNYIDLTFWAESGVVIVVDDRDGSRNAVSPTSWHERALAIGREASRAQYYKEKIAMRTVANDMIRCAQEAVDMGDPTDPKVIEYQARHRSRNSIQVPKMPKFSPNGHVRPGGLIVP